MAEQQLLPLDEAARQYFGDHSGITGKTLAHLSRRGKLRTRKIARRLFVTPADVAAMIAAAPGATSRPNPSPSIRKADAPPSLGANIAMRAIEAL